MQLANIFAKDITRHFEGVVKAADERHLRTELDEYVLTDEISRNIENLLEEYTDYRHANGVWISGFFGSGKSHLLKMLAHLLGEVEGSSVSRAEVVEEFIGKAQQPTLRGKLRNAAQIPARSLLFNIDEKAELTSKDQRDALAGVFVKVFDEARGYYGSNPPLARLEKDLDRAGFYEQFQDKFEEISGIPWREGREQSIFVSHDIDQAYAAVRGERAVEGILQRYENTNTLSIEAFAKEVGEWLRAQDDPRLRINFFVDEVGQFIGTNTQLMLNLQTIAETLNTQCGGRSWIFVTSQEELVTVIGERTARGGTDFSKIQDRFKTTVKLTSTDVEEVVGRRLLQKTDEGSNALADLYLKQKPHFQTLFRFKDESRDYRSYQSEAAFITTYPFVNYQFPLFQDALRRLSDHGVFEGRHRSVGARSLLSVAQRVATSIIDQPVGHLASFDMMFAGIDMTLKSAALASIRTAENQLGQTSLEARLLKVLFLVKYVENFKSTARNLAILVYRSFDEALPALEVEVENALNELVKGTYIRRDGDFYEFLTDEEQDIEREIRALEIDGSTEQRRLLELLTGNVLKSRKVVYRKNDQSFPFSVMIDGLSDRRNEDLTLEFLTGYSRDDMDRLKTRRLGEGNLLVALNPSATFWKDLRLFLQTEAYLRQKHSSTLSKTQNMILDHKGVANHDLYRSLVDQVRVLVAESPMIANATEIPPVTSGAGAWERIEKGFQGLISNTFTQLSLLGGKTFDEQNLDAYADPGEGGLEIDSAQMLGPAAQSVLGFLESSSIHTGTVSSVRTVVERFEGKPYGWDLGSIETVLAFLSGDGKIQLSIDGRRLPRTQVPAALRNTRQHPQMVIRVLKDYDPQQMRQLREFVSDYTNQPCSEKDSDTLVEQARAALQEALANIKQFRTFRGYPFLEALRDPQQNLDGALESGTEYFLTDFNGSPLQSQLLDDKYDLLDPITQFFKGQQKDIFDLARATLDRNLENLRHVPADVPTKMRQILDHPQPYSGSRMRQLKELTETLDTQIAQVLDEARQHLAAKIEGVKEKVLASSDYEMAEASAQQRANQTFDQVLTTLQNTRQVDSVRATEARFRNETYPGILNLLAESVAQTQVPPVVTVTDASAGSPVDPPSALEASQAASAPSAESRVPAQAQHPPATAVPEHPAPRILKAVPFSAVAVPGIVGPLETAEEVEEYVTALRSALLTALDEGKRVIL